MLSKIHLFFSFEMERKFSSNIREMFCENAFYTDHNQKMVNFLTSNRVEPSKAKILKILNTHLRIIFCSIGQMNWCDFHLPVSDARPPTIRVFSEFEDPHPSLGVSSRPLIFDIGIERDDEGTGSGNGFELTSSPKQILNGQQYDKILNYTSTVN